MQGGNLKKTKLLEEAKIKIAKEYNLNVRKPKARRSVAQKLIKHFKKLEVQPEIIAELMLYNIEMAQIFSSERRIKQESFYVSMLNSFREAVAYVFDYNLDTYFIQKLEKITDESYHQKWFNHVAFENTLQGMISR